MAQSEEKPKGNGGRGRGIRIGRSGTRFEAVKLLQSSREETETVSCFVRVSRPQVEDEDDVSMTSSIFLFLFSVFLL